MSLFSTLNGIMGGNSQTIWLATADSNFTRSLDGGATWSATQTTINNGVYGIPNGTFMGAKDTDIFRSTDNGATFSSVFTTLTARVNDFSTDQAENWVAVGSSGGFALSSDNGATWSLNSTDSFGSNDVAGVTTDRDGTWVAIGQGSNIAVSSDNGANWTAATTQPVVATFFDVSTDTSNWIAVGEGAANNGMAKSTNLGVTWAAITTQPFGANKKITGIANFRGIWIAVGDGSPTFNVGISVSTDAGATWSALVTNTSVATTGQKVAVDNKGVFFVYDSSRQVMISEDGGLTWGSPISTGTTGTVRDDSQHLGSNAGNI